MTRREIDRNVARLIEDYDIPRATSAPPHLEDRWVSQLVSHVVLLALALAGCKNTSLVSVVEGPEGPLVQRS